MSKKMWYSLMAVLMIATMVLSACGGAQPEAPSEPEGAEFAVGVVLPTREEPRWIQDETRFRDALRDGDSLG